MPVEFPRPVKRMVVRTGAVLRGQDFFSHAQANLGCQRMQQSIRSGIAETECIKGSRLEASSIPYEAYEYGAYKDGGDGSHALNSTPDGGREMMEVGAGDSRDTRLEGGVPCGYR